MIHPTAIVAASARLDASVTVGPYAVIDRLARVGAGSVIHAHAVVAGDTTLGEGCEVFPFAVLGLSAQDRKDRAPGCLRIAARNVFREHSTAHVGANGECTEIGSDNLFMIGSHVAHDVHIGSHVTLANGVQLAGHVVVEDHVTFGGLAAVQQFARIGESAFVAAGAMVERSVLPFVTMQGDRARPRGINRIGLARRGVPEETIRALERAYHHVFASGGTVRERAQTLDLDVPLVARFRAALLQD